MRSFDYTAVPADLETTPIINLLLSIREHRGRQLALSQVKPDILIALIEEAKIQSTRSSNGLEGIITTQKRLEGIMSYSIKPSTRAEEEIAGYRDVLSLIHEQHDFIPITPSVILQLHRDLMSHTAASYGGHWKDGDNEIVSIDNQGNRVVRFRPPSAISTPKLIEEACQSLNEALSKQICDPLLISLRFIFDFVSIHPFNDGNGRMSRLLTTLLLEKTGYDVARYISIERLIEDNKVLYYDALAESSTGWSENQNSEVPFIRFMLGTILAAYRQLEERTGIDFDEHQALKQDRIASLFQRRPGVIRKSDILSLYPDISEITVKRTLGGLVKLGAIEKKGAGRSTGYVLKDAQALEQYSRESPSRKKATSAQGSPKDELPKRIKRADNEIDHGLYEDYDSFSDRMKSRYGLWQPNRPGFHD